MEQSVADRIRQRLEEFTYDLESGTILEQKYRCKRVLIQPKTAPFKLKPRDRGPDTRVRGSAA